MAAGDRGKAATATTELSVNVRVGNMERAQRATRVCLELNTFNRRHCCRRKDASSTKASAQLNSTTAEA